VHGAKRIATALDIETYGVDDSKSASHSANHRSIVADIGPDNLQSRWPIAKELSSPLWMP
jgi:hypothetical protein